MPRTPLVHALSLALVTALPLAGCAPQETEEVVIFEPPPEPDTAQTVFPGGYTRTVNASVEEVVMAGVLALNTVNMVGARGDVVDGEGAVLAATPTGERIYIDVDRLGQERSRFALSIGTFGDQELARLIRDWMVYYLQRGVATTPAQVPYHIIEPEDPIDVAPSEDLSAPLQRQQEAEWSEPNEAE